MESARRRLRRGASPAAAVCRRFALTSIASEVHRRGAGAGFRSGKSDGFPEVRRVPRMIPMAIAASREALAMAGIAFARRRFRIAAQDGRRPGHRWRRAGVCRRAVPHILHRGEGLALLHHRRHARQSLQRVIHRAAAARPVARSLHRLHQQHRCARLRGDADPLRHDPDDARRRGGFPHRAGHPHGVRENARRSPPGDGRTRPRPRARSASIAMASCLAKGRGCSCWKTRNTPWPAGRQSSRNWRDMHRLAMPITACRSRRR